MILFRCDSSFQIGTGHVVRCLHLATLLKELGHTVEFLCQADPGNINAQIQARGFQVHESSDADFSLIQSLKPDWIVIDHYGIDHQWEDQIPSNTRIFVIDDLVNRKHRCDVLLDQNFRSDGANYKQLVPTPCRLLLGPRYCLLRPELVKPLAAKKISPRPNVVAFFGGSDESGELLKLAQNLTAEKSDTHFDLICLNSHRHLEALKKLKLPSYATLHVDSPNWTHFLMSADFYLGSGGTVTWERFYLGLPGAVLSVAANQESVSQHLADEGYQYYWGPAQQFDYSKIQTKLEKILTTETSTLEKMSFLDLTLVDRFSRELAQEIFGSSPES